MTESELYKELGGLTKSKERWEENVPYVATLLTSESTKIKAKALWLLGEMGLAHPRADGGSRDVPCARQTPTGLCEALPGVAE